MKFKIILIVCFFFVLNKVYSQRFSGGFKAGYNINKFEGPAIKDANGQVLQTFKNDNGFHVGAIFNYELTKNFGLRSHLLYTQRGVVTNYTSEDSYLVLRALDGRKEFAAGEKTISISTNNSYLEIPLLVYGTYKKFEVVFGASMGLMVTSSAAGSIDFDGEWRREDVVINSRISHKYYSDNATTIDFLNSNTFTSGFESFSFPKTHTAYYELDAKEGSLFAPVNFGLTGELNYYFNKGLFLGIGYYYGINDVTRNAVDLDWHEIDDNGFIQTRNDDDRFSTIRLSVGFRF